MEKVKKPIYKRWWFIALMVYLGVILVAGISILLDPEERTKLAQENAEKEKKELQLKEEERKKKEEEKKKEETLDYKVRKHVHEAFGEKNSFNKNDSIVDIKFNEDNGFLLIKVYGKDAWSNDSTKKSMWIDSTKVLKKLKDENEIKEVAFNIVFPLKDQYGNSSDDIVMKATFKKETIDKINFDKFDKDNFTDVADEYWEHPVLKK